MPTAGPAALADELVAAGYLTQDWVSAVAGVPRDAFLPDRVWVCGEGGVSPVDRGTQPDVWAALAHQDVAVVTQVEETGRGGSNVPSSSASMPSVVARMLAELRVAVGHQVLEIGTGTGYNAALLAHRLGSEHITTVEVDPRLAIVARAALAVVGYTPRVVVGDGAKGWARGAPYDRIIATCAVQDVPGAWIEQTVPGGIIVAPWGTGLLNGVLVRLAVRNTPAGPEAAGPVVGDAAFMWMRAQAPAVRDVMAAVVDPDDAVISRTRLDPRYPFGDHDAAFAVGVLVPRARFTVGHGPAGEWTTWLADHVTGSWASVDFVPDADDFEVCQHGPRSLWTEVERAHRWWRDAGGPARTRFGLTVTPRGQAVWLDRPEDVLPVPRP